MKKLIFLFAFLSLPALTHGASNRYVVTTTTSSISEDLLGTISASSSTAISFTGLAGAKYSQYVLVIDRLIPAVSTTNVKFQLSTGSGFLSTGYSHEAFAITSSTGIIGGSPSDTSWIISSSTFTVGNVLNQSFSGTVTINCPDNVSAKKSATWQMNGIFTGNMFGTVFGGGDVNTNSAVIDGVSISMSTYNVLSGKFRLYGIRNSQT